jgi:hypothetical protein
MRAMTLPEVFDDSWDVLKKENIIPPCCDV